MGSQVTFLQNKKPPLCLGQYHIGMKHKIETPEMLKAESFGSDIYLSVVGERFSLDPAIVHALFPPEGSRGFFHRIVPHVALSRATFPWERRACGEHEPDESIPWIALLLFDEEELATGGVIQKTVMLGELLNRKEGEKPLFPKIELEIGQEPKDRVHVVDVRKSLLESMLPTCEELGVLAHVRSVGDKTGGVELAVVICNRLPKQGSSSIVHLVSVEGRYGKSAFNYQGAHDDDFVRLVSLKSWSFICAPEQDDTDESFNSMARRLSVANGRLEVAEDADPATKKDLFWDCSLLSHTLRNGDRSYSWYHGPLAAREWKAEFDGAEEGFPESSDALMRYLADMDLFDASYAAAFELGRVMALDDARFAATLYQWKRHVLTRSHIDAQRGRDSVDTLIADNVNAARYKYDDAVLRVLESRHQELSGDLADLFADKENWRKPRSRLEFSALLDERIHDDKLRPITAEMLELFSEQGRREAKALADLILWLEAAFRFEHVPFNYLVPDEGLLRPESVRFFRTDLHWLESLILGAFSIGHSLRTGVDAEETLRTLFKPYLRETSGLLLRSSLVSGYPDLTVDCFGASNEEIKLLRTARLSNDILFCLFDGSLAEARLYLKAEGMHYHIDADSGEYGSTSKLAIKVLANRRISIAAVKGQSGEAEPRMDSTLFATSIIAKPSGRKFKMESR